MRKFFVILIVLVSVYSDLSANVKEPEVRVIHFIPSDIRDIDIVSDDFLRDRITAVQVYYKNELARNGYDPQTFKTELNENERIKIIRFKSLFPLIYYQMTWSNSNPANDRANESLKIHSLISNELKSKGVANVHPNGGVNLVFLAGAKNIVYDPKNPISAVSLEQSDRNDIRWFYNIIPTKMSTKTFEIAIGHEMGHSFLTLGVAHNHSQGYLMNEAASGDINDLKLSSVEARLISQSRYIHYDLLPPTLIRRPTADLFVDVNFDGRVDLQDVEIVRKAINGQRTGYDTDINNDGVTDEADVNIVKIAAMNAIIAASPAKMKIRISTWGEIKNR